MAAFNFTATDSQGIPQRGTLDGASLDEVRGRLLERGWSVMTLSPAASTVATSVLSTEDAEELVQHVARLTSAGFPLGAGFRAAAEECASARVAQSLQSLAQRIDQGQSLATVLQDSGNWLPPHVSGLIVASLRTGRLGEALLELVEHQQAAKSLRRGIWQAFAYPVTVSVLAAIVLGFLGIWLSSVFQTVFAEFQLQLPLATRQLFWWRDFGIWWLGAAALLSIACALMYRHRSGRAAWTRFITSFPLIGPLWHLRGLAEWSSLMSVLVRNKVPLPDALRWSADGVSNAWIAHRSRMWANYAAMGQCVAEMLSNRPDFPSGIVPLIQWGERHGLLAEAFAAGREVLERRTRLRAELLRTVIPPLLLLAIGCCVSTILFGLFMPILSLIQGLS